MFLVKSLARKALRMDTQDHRLREIRAILAPFYLHYHGPRRKILQVIDAPTIDALWTLVAESRDPAALTAASEKGETSAVPDPHNSYDVPRRL